MANVAIVTDSFTSIPAEAAAEYGLIVAPIQVVIDGKVHRDGIDITLEEHYPILSSALEKGEAPTASAAGVEDIEAAFEQALDRAPVVVGVMAAGSLSGSLAAARTAKQTSFPQAVIHILDSQQVMAGQALLALAAAKTAQEGHSDDYIVAMMERLIPYTRTLLTVETVAPFAANGWLTVTEELQHALEGQAPLLQISEGEVRLVARLRTRQQALTRMLDLVEDDAGDGPLTVCVCHVRRGPEARELLEAIESRFSVEDSYIFELGLAAMVHTGPHAVGFGYYPTMYE